MAYFSKLDDFLLFAFYMCFLLIIPTEIRFYNHQTTCVNPVRVNLKLWGFLSRAAITSKPKSKYVLGSKNSSIYNTICLFTWPMEQTNQQPSV